MLLASAMDAEAVFLEAVSAARSSCPIFRSWIVDESFQLQVRTLEAGHIEQVGQYVGVGADGQVLQL